ncbi:MAG: hypothetical protein AAGC46_20370, partial [Solirubrobacteraceae bacterium]
MASPATRALAACLLTLACAAVPTAADACTHHGKRSGETIHGTAKADRLFGELGNDRIFGGAGDDILEG